MRKLLPLVLVLIILIPAVIAIVSYRNTLSDPPDVGTVSAMKLVTLSGREYDLRAEEDSEIIDIFVAMMQDTTKVTSLPIQFTGRHYTVSVAAKSDVVLV